MEFDSGAKRRGFLSSQPRDSRADKPRLVIGNAGDHRLVHEMLRLANQAPSYEEFLTWLDEPSYEPTDRLLVKLGGQIIAHLQVLNRAAWFHGVKLPVGILATLATLPEHHDADCERLLVSAAEQALRDSQAVVALTRTDRGDVFRAADWSDFGSPCYSEANVNDVLARMETPPDDPPLGRRTRPLRIRLWRQVELAGLLDVYRHSAAATWGALDRSEAYWRWLVGRNVHDELIVAINGRDEWDVLDAPAHIVGYAITRGAQVVELATLPAFRRAAVPLLARACQDAIERDQRTLSLHIPPADPLHKLLLSAGGCWLSSGRSGGSSWMAKLLDPVRWIESIGEVLLERAKAAGLARPLSIAFDTGRHKLRVELTRRSSHLFRDDDAAPDVRCTPADFGALLLGTVDVTAACEASRFEFCTPDVAARLAALFPRVPLWQSPLDSLRI